jgi:3-hydroxyacyl-CoA dehydrogenase
VAERAGIVGAGLIGRAWAIAFARAGWEARLWDPVEGAAAASLATVDGLLADLAARGLLGGQTPEAVRARMVEVGGLGAALDGVAWVQENAPERLDLKRELWGELDRLAPAGAVLASSTSALLPSRFTSTSLAATAASSSTRSTRPTCSRPRSSARRRGPRRRRWTGRRR